MFPGGRKRGRETEKECLRREIKEELPKLKLGPLKLWKEVKAKNHRCGVDERCYFLAGKASGDLTIGDKHEIDRAVWRKPRGIRLTPTSRYIQTNCFPKSAERRTRAHTVGNGLKPAALTRVFRSASTGAAKCSGWFSELCLSGATGGTGRANLEAHRCSNFL